MVTAAPLPVDPLVVAAVVASVERVVGANRVPRPASDAGALARYWQCVAEIYGDDLALRVATDLPAGAFGLASYAVISAPTLGDAVHILIRGHLARLVPELELAVVPSGDVLDVVARARDAAHADALIVFEEVLLAILARRMTTLPVDPVRVRGVTLRRSPPRDARPWRDFFGVTPSFGAAHSALRLAASTLQVVMRTSNRELQRMFGESEHPLESTIVDAVRAHVRTRLRRTPDQAQVARALGMSLRSLQRQLAQHGMPYRDLVATLRLEVARSMLELGHQTISEITHAVGFERAASFSRAFTRVHGASPQEFRDRYRAPGT